jgi:hypothetical protein
MKLHDLCEAFDALGFPGIGVQAHPERSLVLDARAATTTAVRDNELLLDCISYEIELLEQGGLRRGLVPFFTIPALGIELAFGYHPPGGRPGPHEHTAWTITAVCRNELEILTYDRTESYRRRELVPKNRFQAEKGRVGFVYEPCIHEPRNTSRDWSLSFHVMSPRDGERPIDDTEPPPPGLSVMARPSPMQDDHPYAYVQAVRQRQVMVRELLRVVESAEGLQARLLRARCCRLGPPETRRSENTRGRGDDGLIVSESPWTLARTHDGLDLDYRCDGDTVTLYADTPNGISEELVINDIARDAIALVVREKSFQIHELPGGLSEEERRSIAEALEETGLFTRSWP